MLRFIYLYENIYFKIIFQEVSAQTENKLSGVSVLPAKSNWDEFTASHQTFKESTKAKRDKFSCILNLLKNALAEELQNTYYLTEDAAQDNVSSVNRVIEQQSLDNNENQLERPIMRDENESNADQEVVMKTTSDFTNLGNEQNIIELPNMIPIFKPRPRPKSELKQNVDFNSTPTRQVPTSKAVAFVPEKIIQTVMSPILGQTQSNQKRAKSSAPIINARQIQKSRAVSFVPEKIIQTNMSPIPNHALFNIPCHRAADVLDMSVLVPKEAPLRNTNVDPIARTAKPNFPSQITAPIDCADEDGTVAMLFKPKNISLEQVYGNLLKKITITVLVPYHISKLGRK